ncbi:putative PWWP domain-containing protein [Homarus americanus]|uniref:Putative PWWP domain-containing protein n=1 Tax=Homarus americanus TaxID=6706 RepID=A0A8J5MNA4_HOMAM|nr:putative PWWP domain-containing protein [Homarus americanus]
MTTPEIKRRIDRGENRHENTDGLPLTREAAAHTTHQPTLAHSHSTLPHRPPPWLKIDAADAHSYLAPTPRNRETERARGMSHLESGSVVWVRLGQAWWPGTITTVAKCPPEYVQALRKMPVAIVKFFHENEYQDVHKSEHIFPYNCDRKEEFIRRGQCVNRNQSHGDVDLLAKFEADVVTAEKLTGGDMNILQTLGEVAGKRRIDYSNLGFGQQKSKKKKEEVVKRGTDIGQAVVYKKVGSRIPGNKMQQAVIQYKVRILPQPKRENSEEDMRAASNWYKCHICGFTCTRLNVIIWHNKVHMKKVYNYDTGIKIPGRRRRKQGTPKTNKDSKRKGKDAKGREHLQHAHTNGQVSESRKSLQDTKQLLMDWADDDEGADGDAAKTVGSDKVRKQNDSDDGYSDIDDYPPPQPKYERKPMPKASDINSAFDALLAATPAIPVTPSSSQTSNYINNDSDSDYSDWEKYYARDSGSNSEEEEVEQESDIKSLCEGKEERNDDTNGQEKREEKDSSGERAVEEEATAKVKEEREENAPSPKVDNSCEDVRSQLHVRTTYQQEELTPEPDEEKQMCINKHYEPTDDVSEPVQGISKPTDDVSEPVQGISEPTDDVSEPVQGISEPTDDVSEPGDVVPRPAEEGQHTGTSPEQLLDDNNEPLENIFDRTDDISSQTEEVSDQTDKDYEPTDEASGRIDEAYEPTDDNYERSNDAFEQTEGDYERTDSMYEQTEDVCEQTKDIEERTEDMDEQKQSDDIYEQSEDVNEQTEDSEGGDKPSEDVYDPSEDVYNPSEDVYAPSEDVYDPSEDVYDPSEDVYDPSEDVYGPTENIDKPSEDVDSPAEDFDGPNDFNDNAAEEDGEQSDHSDGQADEPYNVGEESPARVDQPDTDTGEANELTQNIDKFSENIGEFTQGLNVGLAESEGITENVEENERLKESGHEPTRRPFDADSDAPEVSHSKTEAEPEDTNEPAKTSDVATTSSSGTTYMLVAVDAHGNTVPTVPTPALSEGGNDLVAVEATMEDGTTRTLYIDPSQLGPNVDLNNLMLHIDSSGQEHVIIPSSSSSDSETPSQELHSTETRGLHQNVSESSNVQAPYPAETRGHQQTNLVESTRHGHYSPARPDENESA